MFVDLAQILRATLAADVRKMPRSRHNPQFIRDTLPVPPSEPVADDARKPTLFGAAEPWGKAGHPGDM